MSSAIWSSRELVSEKVVVITENFLNLKGLLSAMIRIG